MEALEAAVLKQGGQWFGEGEFEFELFEGQRKHRGHGFQLQGWRYPCVLQADGTLAFDHYHGVWGDPALLEDRLPADYIIEAARVAAAAQGWLAEDTAEGLVVHHPDGGTLTITGSGLEAAGFLGGSCHAATDVLTELMGAEGERMLKPEALQQAQQVEVTA